MANRRMNELLPRMQLQDDLADVFGNLVDDVLGTRGFAATYPGVNVWEDGDNAYVEAELPDVTMNDIEVDVMGDQVTIRGQRKIPDPPQGGTYRRRERPEGAFSRMLQLPWEINPDQVEAKLQDGILTVRLPKSESAKPRKIPVQPS
ncbi:MAG TPA: Hsp20/alpha crystallin family protein [Tepidisphaeraceae bacterium]